MIAQVAINPSTIRSHHHDHDGPYLTTQFHSRI